MNKVYITEKVELNGNTMHEGGIYTVSPEDKQKLIEKGVAEEVQFNSLDAIQLSISRTVEEYKKVRDVIKKASRYNDAESLREYELQQLREKLDADIETLRREYMVELKAVEKEIAQKALQVNYETDKNVEAFLNAELTKLSYTDNVVRDLELLAIKINAIDEDKKPTVLANYAKIKNAVKDYNGQDKERVKTLLADIYNAVKSANKSAEYDRKLLHLKAVKQNASSIDLPYKVLRMAEEGKFKGDN